MPFRDDSVDAICDLVDAYASKRRRRIDRARKSFLRSVDKPYFYQLLDSDVPMRRIPDEWRQEYLNNRPLPKMREDLVVAFDEIGSLKTRLWVVSGALTGCCGVILWLANQLVSCWGVVHAATAASKLVH